MTKNECINHVAFFLNDFRGKNMLTLNDLSESLNVTRQAISLWTKKNFPKNDTLKLLSDISNTSIDKILTGKEFYGKKRGQMKGTIGERLLKLRKEFGCNANDVAYLMGNVDGTVYSWENGVNIPKAYESASLAHIYEVSIQWLMTGEEFAE